MEWIMNRSTKWEISLIISKFYKLIISKVNIAKNSEKISQINDRKIIKFIFLSNFYSKSGNYINAKW